MAVRFGVAFPESVRPVRGLVLGTPETKTPDRRLCLGRIGSDKVVWGTLPNYWLVHSSCDLRL
jgi:hypothetical protein